MVRGSDAFKKSQADKAIENILTSNAAAFDKAMSRVAQGLITAEQGAREFARAASISDFEKLYVDLGRLTQEISDAAQAQKDAYEKRVTETQEFITKLQGEMPVTNLEKFIDMQKKLNFAVGEGMLSMAEKDAILAEQKKSLVNLMEAEISAQQRFNDEHMRMQQFLQAGAISVQQFNDHMALFRDELNKPFFDRAKQIRESIKTPAERDAELIRELAGLINAGMINQQEATKFLMQQAQENSQAMNTELPQSVSLGTREAYDLMNKVNNQIATGQLNVQRQQLLEQKRANELLQQINAKPDIGIVQ